MQEPPPMLSSLRRPALYRVVLENVKEYILAARLQPGAPLPPEHELARSLGVSRGSLREAIKVLEAFGIVETRQGAGMYVGSFSLTPILQNLPYGLLMDETQPLELLQIREMLEVSLIPEALTRLGPADLDQLDELVDKMSDAASRHEWARDVDKLFHTTLWMAAGNSVLPQLMDIFWTVVYRMQDVNRDNPEVLRERVQDHRDIVAALRTGDAEFAQEKMRVHFADIRPHLQSLHPTDGTDQGGSGTVT